MWNLKRTLFAAGGGAFAAALLFGGAVMAQTPPGTTPTPPTTPPGTSQPGAQLDPDCPKDGAATGSGTTQQRARGTSRSGAAPI